LGKWRWTKGILLILGLVVLASLVGVVAYRQGVAIPLTLVEGLFASLVISTIFYGISFIDTLKSDVKDCPSKCVKLNSLGIDDIKDIDDLNNRNEINKEFWDFILHNSNKEDLYMMGHSLNDWIKEPYLENFKKALNRVITNNHSVKIIIHGLENNDNNDVLKTKITETINVINEFINTLKNSRRNNIQFVHINNDMSVPYMYIKNDRYTYVLIYYTGSDSKHSILVKYLNEGKIADGYKTDYENLFNKVKNNNLCPVGGQS